MSSNWNHPVQDGGDAYSSWPTKLRFPPEPRVKESGLLTTYRGSVLCLRELGMGDLPSPTADKEAYDEFIDQCVWAGYSVLESLPSWHKHSTHDAGDRPGNQTQAYTIDNAAKKALSPTYIDGREFWSGRTSTHTSSAAEGAAGSSAYDRFAAGLLRNHSENERQYIESCKEAERLEVIEEGVMEVWRMTYVTPPPTQPRTFIILIITVPLPYKSTSRPAPASPNATSRPIPDDGPASGNDVAGRREFMVISLPFRHDKCLPKTGAESKRVRARYCSVERVRERDDGGVEWGMATTSDAGGNIPAFLTKMTLPGKICEDVPSFLSWLDKK